MTDRPTTIPDFPPRLQIQTSSACGAACRICPHPVESPRWTNRLMPPEVFERVVEQIRGRPVEHLCPYLMADGLSDRRLFERLDALRGAVPGAHVEISTTGLYLAPKLADRLLEAPIDELRISSHGLSAEEYAQTMPGVDFERAMANIDRLVERWSRTRPFALSIVCLWGLWSRERETEIARHWADRGVELSRWRVVSRGEQVDLTVFGDGSADPMRDVYVRDEPPYACRFRRDTEWFHVLSDGRVTLCCMDYRQEAILGDVRTDTIESIWHGEPYARMRARIRGDEPMPEDALCRRCEWHVSAAALEREAARREVAAAPA